MKLKTVCTLNDHERYDLWKDGVCPYCGCGHSVMEGKIRNYNRPGYFIKYECIDSNGGCGAMNRFSGPMVREE